MFWVISVYFNIRNTLPKSGTFLLGHPAYVCVYTYARALIWVEIAYALTLVPNNSASETFLHNSGVMRSVDWLVITGAPACAD